MVFNPYLWSESLPIAICAIFCPIRLWALGLHIKTWNFIFSVISLYHRLPLWLRWLRILQCRRPGFDPCIGMLPWRRERLPTPVFWPGEFHGLYSPWSYKESDTTEQLSLHFTLLYHLRKRKEERVLYTHSALVFFWGRLRSS